MYTKDMITVVKTIGGNLYTLTKEHLLSRTYTGNSSNSNDISLGCVGANSYNFSISNLDGKFDQGIFKTGSVMLSVKDSANSDVFDIGAFNIETVKKESGAINLTSTDSMVKFDVKFMGGTFPMTIGYLVNLLCTQLEIELATPDFTNATFTIKSGEGLVGKTCREILLLCCELCGLFANINLKGQLELKWYDFTKIVHEFDYDDFSSFTCDEAPVQITGVIYYIGENRYIAGNDGNPFVLKSDNPLLADVSETEIQGLLDALYEEKIDTLGYLPCTFSTPNYVNLSPGDVIKVQDEKRRWFVALVTELKITDMLELHVKSVGKSLVDKSSKGGSTGGGGDKGDKIGYLSGRNQKAYSNISSGGQTLCLAAFTAEPDTKFYASTCIRYTLDSDTEIKVEYRANGTPNEVFFDQGHKGGNTFTANFIPFALKPGTVALDIKLYTTGAAIAAVEKNKASIDILVKNGTVVETPPYPEISISQSFNAVNIEEINTVVSVAKINETFVFETQEPQAGTISQDFAAVTILEDAVVQVCVFTDTLGISRVIKGEILKFNKDWKQRYTYSERYMFVDTDFKEQQTYMFSGATGVIDSGKLFEIPVNTTEFKSINGLEVV